ncbi:MAG: PGPGW domain-containing protein [Pseudomonadota bacterium]
MVSDIWAFVAGHPEWSWALAIVSAITFFGSLALLPYLIVRLPDDYYLTPDVDSTGEPRAWRSVALALARNTLGAILLLAGIVMLVLPGQGLLTILAALALMDFPGKRRAERRILSNPKVLSAANWIRERAGRKPLRLR